MSTPPCYWVWRAPVEGDPASRAWLLIADMRVSAGHVYSVMPFMSFTAIWHFHVIMNIFYILLSLGRKADCIGELLHSKYLHKFIRILRSCSMKIFPYINISKCNYWLVICVAKNLIWTTLKKIFSIFRFFLKPPDFQILSKPYINGNIIIQLSNDA